MPNTAIGPRRLRTALALALPGGALARRGLAFCALGCALFRAAPLGGALLGRLLGGLLGHLLRRSELHERFARDRVGDTEVASEIFEEPAHLVQHRDHLRTGVHDALEIPPFADQAERLVTGPHQASADEALERGPHVAMGLDERFRVA